MHNPSLCPQVFASEENIKHFKDDAYLGAVAVMGSAHDVYLRSEIAPNDTIIVQSGPYPEVHKSRSVPLSIASEHAAKDVVLQRALELWDNHLHAQHFADLMRDIMEQHNSGLITDIELLNSVSEAAMRSVAMLKV